MSVFHVSFVYRMILGVGVIIIQWSLKREKCAVPLSLFCIASCDLQSPHWN